MAVSGINNYNDVLYTWQSQQLKSTGNSSSSSTNAASALFNNGTSMVNQISSMVELTKYAMDAMGVTGNSRVTFSQINKYKEQLQSEFTQGVKEGLANSGISDLAGLKFKLGKDDTISAIGANASDRKKAQAWLDANHEFGKKLSSALQSADIDSTEISFRISSTGKLSVIDNTSQTIQSALDSKGDLTDSLRKGLAEAGISINGTLNFKFEDGNLVAEGSSENIKNVNNWLKDNPALENEIKSQLAKYNLDPSAASLSLAKEGTIQISVNNAELKDIQKVLDKSSDMGSSLAQGLNNLGIDPSITFSIQIDAAGNFQIITDHPDKAKLENFFEENPELIKKYRQVETLAGIDDARKAMQISPNEMRKRIQIESLASWWAESDSSNSYFGKYSNNNLSLLSGLNMRV